MAQRKSYDERIQDLQKKLDQLKAQERDLKKRQSAEERRLRTKRLIETGAAVESVLKKTLGETDGQINKTDLPALISFLQDQEDRGKFFSSAIIKVRNTEQTMSTSGATSDNP